jgi:glyoxylase-like metal-dependent hydrolase (beta-lactamase superfamily II)
MRKPILKALIILFIMIAVFDFAVAAQQENKAEENLVWDAGAVQLQKQQLAPGVYAVYPTDARAKNPKGYPVATSGGFVVGTKGVLVIESMVNARLARQVMKLVREVTDKPILYLVNTSYHGDHAYGNYAFPKSVQIIQHSKTKAFMDDPQAFAADKKFMVQYFGAKRGIEDVEARTADIIVDDKKIIDLGNKKVEIRHFGFAQTPGDLFVWVPKDKVLWTGNPVVAQKPALPWLLDGRHQEVLATLKKIRAFLPETAIVVPGHGVPIKPEDMDFKIQYLEALHNQTKNAVDKGLSLEQIKKTVTLPEFQGYGLFGWVHFGVNLPAAYKDISQQKQN